MEVNIDHPKYFVANLLIISCNNSDNFGATELRFFMEVKRGCSFSGFPKDKYLTSMKY